MTFSSFPIDARILRGVEDLGFTQPTPIQRDAIPPGLDGRDVLACAMTGSGKSAAFLIPVLQRIIRAQRGTTRALVLTPTRELAAQIHDHLRALGRHAGVSSAAVFGGVDMRPQTRALREGASVIIATPGRLLDHLQQGNGRFAGIEVLVLDEADRMLDMGFLPDIRRIMRHVPAKRQTLFFSATMPPEIARLSREMLRDPVQINAERQAAPATGVVQSAYPVQGDRKNALLVEMLNLSEDMKSVLVFTRTKHRANRVAEFLADHRIPSERIHGNRSQSQRTKALAGFKNRRFRVLVATDIAARGIDVSDLSHVVNLDVPNVSEDYIHRVGRTARAGATGHAFTFVSPEEEKDLHAIERAIGKKIPRTTVDGFDYGPAHARRAHGPTHAHSRGEPRHQARRPQGPGHGSAHGHARPAPAHPAHRRARFGGSGGRSRRRS